MPLYTVLHNLLNVLVQTANRMGLQKKLDCHYMQTVGEAVCMWKTIPAQQQHTITKLWEISCGSRSWEGILCDRDITQLNMVIHTICISCSSILMAVTMSIRSGMLTGQSYTVALKPSQTVQIFFFSDWPRKNMMKSDLCTGVFCVQKTKAYINNLFTGDTCR
jgi:hypothetical protein